MNFSKPNIVVSKCIEFDKCRYNGDIIHSSAVSDLKEFVNFIPVCPEVEIGLGIPRPTIKIIENKEGRILVGSTSGQNITEKMNEFTESFFYNINKSEIDGFLLKSSSPSCGYKDSKVYSTLEKGMAVRKNSSGFFTEKAEENFPNLFYETEGRLENFGIREEYYTKIFVSAKLREIIKNDKIKELIEFHSKNKYLLMSYSSNQLKKLGNIIANREKKELKDVFSEYKKEFQNTMKKNRKAGGNINVMLHIMGYFSEKIKKEERDFFLEKIEEYKNKMIPLSLIVSILESWTIRFNEEYLEGQSIFNPFPKKLIRVTDSGKGRDI